MNPFKSQDQYHRRSGDTSREWALLRNIQHQRNQNGSQPKVSPFLLQRAQPISLEKLRSTLQAALDLSESLDLDLDLDLDLEEEFDALEQSLRG
jgi:hypothetical protein